MPRKLFAAISQIVLGALIAIAPQTFAHVCAVKDMPMACRYTARVALGLGVVIALLAIIGFFAPSRVRAGLDIANAVLFYASDLSDYVTGDSMNVNGGLYM